MCIWCGHKKILQQGKKFCQKCELKGPECSGCHRPMPSNKYEFSSTHCNTCFKKKEKTSERFALGGCVHTSVIHSNKKCRDSVLSFFEMKGHIVDRILFDGINKNRGIKYYLTLKVRFHKVDSDGDEMISEPVFQTSPSILLKSNKLDTSEQFEVLYRKVQEYLREGSGWTLDRVLKMEVKTVPFKPMEGSSYIATPPEIKSREAIVNIKNSDTKCFIWSILAGLHEQKVNPNRVNLYKPYEKELKVDGIEFPMTVNQIPKFEKQNTISINVIAYDERELYPIYVTKFKFERHVNLLLISEGEKHHYCLIKSMSRLLTNRTKHHATQYYCNYCLHGFSRQDLLEAHVPYCQVHGAQKVKIPNESDKYLEFNNYMRQLKVPFCIYADFECTTKEIMSCEKNPDESSTEKYQKHEPNSFAYKVVSSDPNYHKNPVNYRGPDAASKFLECMLKEEREIETILSNIKPMQLTSEEEEAFKTATVCHICDKDLGTERVRDHCHLSGKFRGAAHNGCNLNFSYKKKDSIFFIPIIIHNLKGYDSHLIMKAMGKVNRRITCIPQNMEKYISFSLGNLRFIDSLQFLNASLEKLVGNLAMDDPTKFTHLRTHYGEDAELLLRKGIYPYDYMNSEERFLEKELPPKEAFYSKLTRQDISEVDYHHAQKVWNHFSMKDMGQYHDLYLTTDVLLLADIFENFRNICLEHYKLDPAHYFTAPGLFWDSMLKKTGVKLELLTDINMHLFIENSIRGGVSMISNRFSQANNTYLPECYDGSKESSYILPLDANNLYGYAMVQSLPVDSFRWLSDDEILQFDVNQVPDDSNTGFIMEVDITYPENLHDEHSDYPLAPESLNVTCDMLSPYSKDILDKLKIKTGTVKKLVPNLCNKKKYIVHYKNLQLYMKYGLKLTKIHRILEFRQAPWMKTYIDFNTTMRKHARNSFEKDFFKLANNAVFGRTLMNVRKHRDVKLVTESEKIKKLSANPNFKGYVIFNENLVGVEMKKSVVKLYQPIYVGFTVLELSKTLMYDFHYGHMKTKYGDKVKLLFTDTDSLTYEIKTGDVYKDMLENINLFDTSEYPKDHMLYSEVNKKVLGKMKDESFGVPPLEFVGLRPKMYSLLSSSNEKKTAKGVSRYIVKNEFKHKNYRKCLLESKVKSVEMRQITSYQHEIYSIKQRKIGLSPYDDKRYILSNGCDTLAHGHYKIKQLNECYDKE